MKPEYADSGKFIIIKGRSIEEESKKNGKFIPVYTAEEIEGIRAACKLGRHVLDEAHKIAKVGVRTDEIDVLIHELCIENEAYPSPLNYYDFPKSVCTSVNEVICHGIPDRRPLENGDILNIDVSVYLKGYHADLNETYLIGEVDKESKFLVESAYKCLEKAIEICKPGTLYREIGNVIGNYIESNGLSVVRTYCGHGVGKLFHTAPNVPHYKNNKAVGSMKVYSLLIRLDIFSQSNL
jgi:methionyl aminopeptidase